MKIELNSLNKINYALASNGRKIISSISLFNDEKINYSNLKVSIKCEPEFFSSFIFEVSFIENGTRIIEENVDVVLNFSYLYELNEAKKGNIIVEVLNNDECIASLTKEIELLSFDEWDGVISGSESVANFVLPNDKNVELLKTKALQILLAENSEFDFFGYTGCDKEYVLKQICSLYLSIAAQNLHYSLPKASFEINGQKVRLPAEILSSKFATCLDSTLLLASLVESIGLHPLVVLTDDHAFLGIWLSDYHYESTSILDSSFLINKYNSKEVVFIETTLLCKTNPASFNDALSGGFRALCKKTTTFFAVDVKSCRINGIKPLPLKVDGENEIKIINENSKNVDFSVDLDNPGYIDGESNKDKFDVWEKKLLDLNGRNKLISFTPNTQFVQLFCTDMYALFDEIFANNLQLLSNSELINATLNDKIYTFLDQTSPILFKNDLKNKRIRLMVSQKNLLSTCKNIFRASKTAIEENGANTLFLTFGTLKYKEKGKDKYAPLILLPLEIYKGTSGQNYFIAMRDDEIVPNQTLFEYLKLNFDINFDDLLKIPYNSQTEKYEIKAYINTLRQRITGITGFSLDESSFIGQFSFTRFIMRNDLRIYHDEFMKNKIIKSLVDPEIPFRNDFEEIRAENLDDYIAPNRFATPLSADSSQTEAIINASKGLSFVLNGPPGTGKSQTITNMIINSLYNHKKVLFVAQKMAALEVVKKRLDETGLGMFCIELHSNKAQKADVLAQISNILELGKLKKPIEYETVASDLLNKRNELNSIISHLHRPLDSGFYLAENILGYEEVKNSTQKENIKGIDYSLITKESFLKTIEQINKFINAKNEVGTENINNFSYIKCENYSIDYRNELEDDLRNFRKTLYDLDEEIKNINCDEVEFNRYFINNFLDTLSFFNNNYNDFYFELFDADEEYFNHLKQLINKLRDLSSIHVLVKSSFDPLILNLNLDNLLFRLNRAKNLNFIRKISETSKIIKELRTYSINPKTISKNNVENILINLIDYNNFSNSLKLEEASLKKYLKDDFEMFNTNTDVVLKKLRVTSLYKNQIDRFKKNGCKNIYKFSSLLMNENYTDITEKISKTLQNSTIFEEKYKFDFAKLDQQNYIEALLGVISNLISNSQKLKDYILYMQEYSSLCNQNVGDLVERNLSNELSDKELVNVYKKTIHYNLSLRAISSDDNLNLFSGRKENEKIEEYKKAIDEYNVLTIKEVASRLSKSTSEFFDGEGSANESKEFMYLKKVISSGGRGVSLRTLFDSTKNIIFDICPCFLMSPLSVAQYFDPKSTEFDIVIFDEASQITTSDAIGALARAKSAIIVGDEKQLPPTRFFEASTVDEDDIFIEDGDSILSDALAISMPKKYLTWHYRSKDESLIAFSNSRYYDNKLLTFPSPKAKNDSITFNYCQDAVYENRKNLKEAQYIAKEVERRLLDPELSKKSIGIVTFSISQQSVILDEIQKIYKKHPDLEFIDNDKHEELFVKNLENVQGDERDVIIFSICYGPDKNNRVSMNFGPLSNKGGEKRLNVAVSRAREEMLIFSSMLPEMIDLNRVSGQGSKNLREFLQYAINGKSHILIKNGEQVHYEEGIERFIANDLRNRGYNVDIDVGTSEFRVDLAIVDPNNPSKYALGILLDSKSYINSKTSKDRNVIQTNVLKGLGWKIFRVWTLDYFDAPDLVIDKIVDAIYKNEEEIVVEKPKIVFEKDEKTKHASKGVDYIVHPYPKFLDSDDFYEYLEETKDVIDFYIKNESPISYRLLLKRVLDSYSISRVGNRIKETFDRLLPKYHNMTGDVKFYWSEPGFRVFSYRIGSKDREFIDIPKEEICLCINDIMKEKLCCTRDELIHYVVVAFGYSKVTDISKKVINISIDLSIALKNLRENDGLLYLFSR